MADREQVDVEAAIDAYQQRLEEERVFRLEQNKPLIDAFKSQCEARGVPAEKVEFDFVRTIGVVAKYPELLLSLRSDLDRDKENLVCCAQLSSVFDKREHLPGYFFGSDYVAMAHPYFRRRLSEDAVFAPKFIELFWTIESNEIDAYLSLDYDRVRLNVDEYSYGEFDTWYGAPFSRKIESIPNGVSKLRPPLDLKKAHISFFFNDAYSLYIKWSEKAGIKTFQAEEFKTRETEIEKNAFVYHPVRYIHAEFDRSKNRFRHLDGAIHYYTESDYLDRRDSNPNYNKHSSAHIKSKSEKLFKLNGAISVDMWAEICCQFFAGNPLIIEYLSGAYPSHVVEALQKIRAVSIR